jgi:hypothetical protein
MSKIEVWEDYKHIKYNYIKIKYIFLDYYKNISIKTMVQVIHMRQGVY